MGRRYRNEMMDKHEVITYHVYVDGVEKATFRGNKQAAKAQMKFLVKSHGKKAVEIRKTRAILSQSD